MTNGTRGRERRASTAHGMVARDACHAPPRVTRARARRQVTWRAPADGVYTVRVESGLGGTPLPLRRTINRKGLFRVQVRALHSTRAQLTLN